MLETAQQYKRRLLGYLGRRDPLRVLRDTPPKIARHISGVPRSFLLRRPLPGKWSIGEIIAHLADDELVGAYRIRRILEVPGGRIDSFDQNVWADSGRYQHRDPNRSLALFFILRQANLGLYASLSPAERRRFGVHAERGKESIERIFTLYAAHDLNHLRQIKAILANRPQANIESRHRRPSRRR